MAETMTRAEIMDAQRMLNRLGIRDNRGRPLRVDGVAGPRTLEALNRYQAQQTSADMPTPAPKGRPANRSTVDRLMPPIPTPKPARMFEDAGLSADIARMPAPMPVTRSMASLTPTPNYDPLGGARPRPPVPSFMFGGPSAGAPPMAPDMGPGMAGGGMAGGEGPEAYRFSGPPMVPDAMQSQWGSPAGLMDAAQMAQGGAPRGLPDMGYTPPPDSFAPAGGPPMQPQGPSDVGGIAQMLAGIQDRAAAGQSPNIQPGVMMRGLGGSLMAQPPPLPRRRPQKPGPSFRERAAQPIPDAYNAPQIGQVVFGYRYLGGDPNDRANWEKVR